MRHHDGRITSVMRLFRKQMANLRTSGGENGFPNDCEKLIRQIQETSRTADDF